MPLALIFAHTGGVHEPPFQRIERHKEEPSGKSLFTGVGSETSWYQAVQDSCNGRSGVVTLHGPLENLN